MLYRPVLQIEVALKIVSDMVGVAPRKRGAYGADHLLGCLCVQTRYVFLQHHYFRKNEGIRNVSKLEQCYNKPPVPTSANQVT